MKKARSFMFTSTVTNLPVKILKLISKGTLKDEWVDYRLDAIAFAKQMSGGADTPLSVRIFCIPLTDYEEPPLHDQTITAKNGHLVSILNNADHYDRDRRTKQRQQDEKEGQTEK